MIIFDRFPSNKSAKLFAKDMQLIHGLRTVVCDSQAEADRYDYFPFLLVPPIVLIDRSNPDTERCIERDCVKMYHGQFAGT